VQLNRGLNLLLLLPPESFQFSVKDQKRQMMVGGGKKIVPTVFSGKIEIPDLNYCFPRDTGNSVKMGIRYLFPISPLVVHDCEKFCNFCKCETCNRAIGAKNSDYAQQLFS
jgi:hypothetical protein